MIRTPNRHRARPCAPLSSASALLVATALLAGSAVAHAQGDEPKSPATRPAPSTAPATAPATAPTTAPADVPTPPAPTPPRTPPRDRAHEAALPPVVEAAIPPAATIVRRAPLATDRPGNGVSPALLLPLRSQLEWSFSMVQNKLNKDTSDEVSTHTFSFPTLLRLGVFSWLEARIASDLFAVRVHNNDDPSEIGPTDVMLGAKLRFLANRGLIPELGLLAQLGVPTGHDDFSTDSVGWDLRALASWRLPAGFTLLANIGFDSGFDPDDPNADFARLIYLAQLSYRVPFFGDRVGLLFEGFGKVALASDRPSFHVIAVGLFLRILDNLQLDALSQHALNEEADDLTVGFGVSYRFR